MDPLFYSPNGSSWTLRGPEVFIDPSKVVTMPVRKYTYQNTKYAILACADMSFPSHIFYKLSISRQNGAEMLSTQERDFRIVKQLLKYAPVSIEQYEISEHKLMRKIANRKRQACVDNMETQNELMESIKSNMNDDKIKDEATKITNEQQRNPITTVDDDDSECLGGIMGVYCRSGIHGDYRDICAGDERRIG